MTPDERAALRERAEWILDDAPHRDSANDPKVMARFALDADDERVRLEETEQLLRERTVLLVRDGVAWRARAEAAEKRVAELEAALRKVQHQFWSSQEGGIGYRECRVWSDTLLAALRPAERVEAPDGDE